MIEQAFINEFADIIEVSPSDITDNYNLLNNAAWDSLAYISTIAMVDKWYDIVIDGDLLSEINQFNELVALIEKREAA